MSTLSMVRRGGVNSMEGTASLFDSCEKQAHGTIRNDSMMFDRSMRLRGMREQDLIILNDT
jgi:hypothetical protein